MAASERCVCLGGRENTVGLIVVGASGFVGRHVVWGAAKRREAVLPVVRSRCRAQRFGLGEASDFAELSATGIRDAGFQGCPVIHVTGASRDEGGSTIESGNVRSTEIIAEAASGAGSSRIIYLSGYGVTAASSDRYFRAKARAEEVVRGCGVPYTIIRSSYVLGLGDELTRYLVASAMNGEIRVPGSGQAKLQPIWIGDLVEVLLRAAANRGPDGEEIELLGEVTSLAELAERLASDISPRARVVGIGLEELMREALTSEDPEFTTGELALLVSDLVGPRTDSCYGIRVRGIGEICEELARSYELDGAS